MTSTSGPRQQIGAIKLLLHRSGRWRMAWTEEYANAAGIPESKDRVLAQWEPPDELRPGWRHAVTVLVMPDSLALQRPEKRLNTVAFFPPPNPSDVLGFRVLLGAPNSELKDTGAVEVGTLQRPSGGMIGVCMRPDPMTPKLATKIREVRTQVLSAVTAIGARATKRSPGDTSITRHVPARPQGGRAGKRGAQRRRAQGRAWQADFRAEDRSTKLTTWGRLAQSPEIVPEEASVPPRFAPWRRSVKSWESHYRAR